MLPNILLPTLGKNKNIISRMIHQLSLVTRPLTVLLTPPNISPTGKAGSEKGIGEADFTGMSDASRFRTGGTAGAGASAGEGVQTGAGGVL